MSRDRFIAAVTTYRTARHVAKVDRENTLRRSVVVVMAIFRLHACVCRSALLLLTCSDMLICWKQQVGGAGDGMLQCGRWSVGRSSVSRPGMCHVEARIARGAPSSSRNQHVRTTRQPDSQTYV